MFAVHLGATSPAPTPQTLGSFGLGYATGWAHDENSGNGYAYFSAQTFVDCEHTRVGYRQSADIFTGGYAHAADGRILSYADMGILLENDSLVRGQIARPNKVQLYGQASTRTGRTIRFTNVSDAPQHVYNVACNSSLRLTFFIASPTEIDVRYDGSFIAKRGNIPFRGRLTARITGFAPADGWSVRCPSCAVRRVNTLAVGSGQPTRPGSYFGFSDKRRRREPTGVWTGSVEGRYLGGSAGDARSYAVRPFTARRRDIVNAPAAAESQPYSRPAFVVLHEGLADERIGLDER